MVDSEVQRLVESRSRSVVLKQRLILFRAASPIILVLVFEGIEDALVYAQWFQRICNSLDYEPFPLKGKDQVLQLRHIVNRDLNGLDRNTLFFMDRDFDDYKGYQPSQTLFMTDRYSIENYLVEPEVMNEVLRNELCCNTYPELRANILAIFNKQYDCFLECMREINFRVFLARKLGIAIQAGIKGALS